MDNDNKPSEAVILATELTVAWLTNPNTRAQANEIPDFLQTMHDAITKLVGETSSEASNETQSSKDEEYTPAVSARKSLSSAEHILSMVDGKPYKSLRRHLSKHGLTPEQYRERYKLKKDYPMVAPAYAEHRRELAKKIGLGRKPRVQNSTSEGQRGSARKRKSVAPETV